MILTEGGDDRLVLNPETKVNKYFCDPYLHTDVLFRGSCTCNLTTKLAYEATEKEYNHLAAGDKSIEASFEESRDRLKKAYNLPEGTGIFLMPSGSDAEYIPLLIT